MPDPSSTNGGIMPALVAVGMRWIVLPFLALAPFFVGLTSFALDSSEDIFQYNCQTWTRQNGLPANGINAIAQTKDGYLWLGTSVGLLRFDGSEFKLIDLGRLRGVRNGIVTSLERARNGGLWVGLENSAYGFFDGQAFSFRGKEEHGKLDMNVRSIFEDKDGAVWLAAERQASRLTPSGLYEEVLGTSATTVIDIACGVEDSHGRKWFGTAYNGVHYWQAGKITKLPDPKLDRTIVRSIAEDLIGQIWLGTDQGLSCYGADLQAKEIPPLTDDIRALLVDSHGTLWIGTSGHGLARYHNGAYAFLRKADGLANDYVKALAEDHEGSLWVGTRSGVSHLTDVKFPTRRAAEDPSIQDALAVAPSRRGGVWIASSAGLTYLDDKTKKYSTTTGLPMPYVKRVYEALNGDVYLVNGIRDLVVYSEKGLLARYSATNMVVGLAEDQHGVVASVGNSLYRAGTNNFAPYVFTNGEPQTAWVLNLAAGRNGAIWVAAGAGIFRVKDGNFQQWGAAEGLGSDTGVWGICEDSEGIVWGSTFYGIVRLKDNRVRRVTRENGLFDNNIYSIVPDDAGQLWVDSSRGIFRVSRRNMNDFFDAKVDRVECHGYDGTEFVKSTDKTVQEHVGCKTLDGRIWFPNPRGVVVIDPAHIPTNPIAPPVHIDSVRANGRDFVRNKNEAVQPGKGELEFHFAGLSFIAPQKMRFRYLLEGYDKDWVEAEDRRLAFYTNLKPGQYTFRVTAANADGVWNAQGDTLAIELLPHYYQTAWFYFICGAASLAALGLIYRARVKILNGRQRALVKTRELLEAEVANRTAELARANNSLRHEVQEHERTETALKNEIQERKQAEEEVKETHKQLLVFSRQAGMAEVATSVLHNVGNVLNSVNVSAGLVADGIRQSQAPSLAKVAALLLEHEGDLAAFLHGDSRGRHLPAYLAQLSEHLLANQSATVEEVNSLRENVEHIKQIVAMQQNYARFGGIKEMVSPVDLVEDSLRLAIADLNRHGVKVKRELEDSPPILTEKHKVLQILVNLIRNAKHACQDSGRPEKLLTLSVSKAADRIKISVIDNGVGIRPENLVHIFNHGFTTRKDGHGFGLHSGALAAREMGGSLTAQSDGPGQGAVFILELPYSSSNGT